jgi:ABC-2 type transport system permease protein
MSLALITDLDLGLLAAATAGVWLAGTMFSAVGLFASSLSSQPGIAALAAYGILILLSIINSAGSAIDPTVTLFDWLAWNEHLFRFLLGIVRLSDVAYYLLFTCLFLALAHRTLANRRLG